ncbi:MAG: hypothetical protein U0905_03590 [Pirellulales bacterium]
MSPIGLLEAPGSARNPFLSAIEGYRQIVQAFRDRVGLIAVLAAATLHAN